MELNDKNISDNTKNINILSDNNLNSGINEKSFVNINKNNLVSILTKVKKINKLNLEWNGYVDTLENIRIERNQAGKSKFKVEKEKFVKMSNKEKKKIEQELKNQEKEEEELLLNKEGEDNNKENDEEPTDSANNDVSTNSANNDESTDSLEKDIIKEEQDNADLQNND